MDNTVLLALITMISSAIITPIVLYWITTHTKEQDWARQDAIQNQLKEIHILVNSNMTAAMQSEYDAQVGMLDLMNKAAIAAGSEGSQVTALAIAATTSKVAALRVALDERQLQQKRIDAGPAKKGP